MRIVVVVVVSVVVVVVLLQVVERMVVPVPWCDHHTPVSLLGGLE